MRLKIKKLHPAAVLPTRAYAGDAGLDLTACSWKNIGSVYLEGLQNEHSPARIEVGFGIAVEIPAGYVGLVFARSSIHKCNLRLSNAVGVIDSGYRGELKAVFDVLHDRWLNGERVKSLEAGKPCAQLVVVPCLTPEVVEVDALTPSERGTGGYGSSDERRGA